VVSVIRLLLVPFVLVLILADQRKTSYLAAALFVIGAATDGLDGYLARRFGPTTRTGQWLDPLADKFLVATPVVALVVLGEFPFWAAVIIVLREITISLLRAMLGLKGKSLPATQAAKVKTTLQLVAITLYILPVGPGWLKLSVLVIAVLFTIYTGALYIVQARIWLQRRAARLTGVRVGPGTDRPASQDGPR
jgi:CDP-diacylglycerol--glycerol-3-phosphate 3-phosphatidyltransferase